ncbi:MAG: TonB family protein [Cyclobacteriaceae bacterium]
MRKKWMFVFLILYFFLTHRPYAQKRVNFFYDSNWALTSREQAVYFRNAWIDTTYFVFLGPTADFFVDGKPQMQGNYEGGRKSGDFTFYYPNGEVKIKGEFTDNQPSGAWHFFYEDASLKQLVQFEGDAYKILTFIDKAGTPKVENGNGLWEGQFTEPVNGTTFYINGRVEAGYPDGWWSYINEEGQIVYEEKFKNGTFRYGQSKNAFREVIERKKEPLDLSLFIPIKLKLTENFTYAPDMTQGDYPFLPFLPRADTLYFDKNWEEAEQSKAHFFRVGNPENLRNPSGLVKDYYLNGQLQMQGYFKKGKKDGHFIYFDPHGDTLQTGTYQDDKKTGAWRYFYPNGLKRMLAYYEEEEKEFIETYWDRDGTVLLSKGSGTFRAHYQQDGQPIKEEGQYRNYQKAGEWKGYEKDGSLLYRETYQRGELVKGERYKPDGMVISYYQLLEHAQPEDGIDAFYKFIKRNLKYPEDARYLNIDGKVIVAIVVDKDGSLKGVKTISSPSPSMARAVEKVVAAYPGWQPAKSRGMAVRMQFLLPITFNLGQ